MITLDMIVRSDPQGLLRAIESAKPYVDAIIVGVDSRSADDTYEVAMRHASSVWTFEAEDLGLTDAQWRADVIDFAKARNLGRAKVSTPWALVLDSDESLVVDPSVDLRKCVREATPEVASFRFNVELDSIVHHDVQRLARTQYRWARASHNMLVFEGAIRHVALKGVKIIHDVSLRSAKEVERRTQQRQSGVDRLEEDAKAGDINAAFHIAKHRIGTRDVDGAEYWTDFFRSRVFPRDVFGSEERAHLAVGLGVLHYDLDNFKEAQQWGLRALLDGPSVDAFCLLGDIAEDLGDWKAARTWYEAACATDPPVAVGMVKTLQVRWGRLAALRAALGIQEKVR